MTRQDMIDIILVVAWTYGNGFLFAWLLVPLGLDPHKTGSVFAFIGWGLGMMGLINRRLSGKFPLGLALMIWPLPLLCSFAGIVWWLVDRVQRWLGVV